MSLLTAHRILIGAAIAFFLFYGAWEVAGAGGGARGGWELRAGAALLGAVGLAFYFRTLFGRRGPGGNGPGGVGGG